MAQLYIRCKKTAGERTACRATNSLYSGQKETIQFCVDKVVVEDDGNDGRERWLGEKGQFTGSWSVVEKGQFTVRCSVVEKGEFTGKWSVVEKGQFTVRYSVVGK